MTQNAHSNTDEKKEKLNQLGVYATAQELEQSLEKLQAAMETLGAAEGEASKASSELQTVESTAPIPEILPKLGATVTELGTAKTKVDGAAESVREAMNHAQGAGIEGIARVCNSAIEMIDVSRSSIDIASQAASAYQKRLEQEAKELDDLDSGASAPQRLAASDPAPTATSRPSDSSISERPNRPSNRPVSTKATHGVTHGTVQRRAGIMNGPVIFSAADGMTSVETGQAREYIDAANTANPKGELSPTGRVSPDYELKRAKNDAARKERERAQAANESYGTDVAAHLPDSTWVGKGDPPGGFGRHTWRLNSSLGAQSTRYPVGYRPTEFLLDDSWEDEDSA